MAKAEKPKKLYTEGPRTVRDRDRVVDYKMPGLMAGEVIVQMILGLVQPTLDEMHVKYDNLVGAIVGFKRLGRPPFPMETIYGEAPAEIHDRVIYGPVRDRMKESLAGDIMLVFKDVEKRPPEVLERFMNLRNFRYVGSIMESDKDTMLVELRKNPDVRVEYLEPQTRRRK